MSRKKEVTLKTIADAVGVSQSMVSRALADKYGVSESMKSKIRLAALDLGYYKPRTDTRKLTGTVTALIHRHDFLDNQFYLQVLEGIEREVSARQIQLGLTVIDAENDSIPYNIQHKKTDGVIVLGKLTPEQFSRYIKFSVPMVMLDTQTSVNRVDRVLVDNYQGAFDAVQYLVDRGHKTICFIGSPDYSYSFSERLRGFKSCAAHCVDQGVHALYATGTYENIDCPCSVEEAYSVLQPQNGVTAVVCANDRIALIVYDIAERLGLKIPDDLSVIGFDNIQDCEKMNPKLTSINVPKAELGRCALMVLLNRISQPDLPFTYTQLSVDIVERDSVRTLKG